MQRVGVLGLVVVALAAAMGCGEEATSPSSVVDPDGEQPTVSSLAIEPDGGAYLLSTNRGFFRARPGAPRAQRLRPRVETRQGESVLGPFLETTVLGAGELVGSGHPADEQALPADLGFLRSNDGGRTWTPVALLGQADLHEIQLAHRRLYAFEAGASAFMSSDDGGRTWERHGSPPEPAVDFAVHPARPQTLVAATERGLYRSTDLGRTWWPLDSAASSRLAWPQPHRLLRADRDGALQVSGDTGESWKRLGRVDGEPADLLAMDGDALHVALSDGTILASEDGGRSFRARFRP